MLTWPICWATLVCRIALRTVASGASVCHVSEGSPHELTPGGVPNPKSEGRENTMREKGSACSHTEFHRSVGEIVDECFLILPSSRFDAQNRRDTKMRSVREWHCMNHVRIDVILWFSHTLMHCATVTNTPITDLLLPSCCFCVAFLFAFTFNFLSILPMCLAASARHF